ncbi:MAG: hypothetical protein ACE5GL_07695, partial [Calditrichia bacterium]
MKDSKKMKNNVSRLTIIIVAVLTISGFVYSFCILSSSQGYPRRYRDSDIPFIYKLNNSTPPDWVAPIDSGAHVWEKVRSSYWEFTNGGFTPINTDNRDGTNLVFFDFQGVNFPPGTNTIAYSRTWTSGGGSFFHALESDLVWNARDFPPSPTGASGQQDLRSTIAHEFGHHLGMGHQGAPGGPPGCGETIQAATMYGLSASGDTTHRSLHIHDKAGVSVIYPSWILQGSVTDGSTGQPFEGVGIISDTLYAANTGPVESPTTGVYEYPGYVEDVTLTDVNGNYATTVLLQQFNVMVAHFGYATQQTQVAFNNPGGIGQTEVKTIDFTMDLSPLANISGTVMDMTTSAPVAATIEVFVTSDKPGAPSGVYADTTTGVNGEYSFSMPAAENYLIVVTPEPPYPMEQHMVVDLATGGQQVDFALPHADVLLVNDDISQDNESNIQQTLINAGLLYHTWRTSEQGSPDT